MGISWEFNGNLMGIQWEFNGNSMDIEMGFVDLVWEDIRINEISWEEHGVFLTIKKGGIVEISWDVKETYDILQSNLWGFRLW